MNHIPLKFRFKGGRDYVHGTDMYNQIIPAMLRSFPEDSIPEIKLTINEVMRRQGRLWTASREENQSRPTGVKAELSLTSSERQVMGWLTEDEEVIGGAYAYDEELIRSRCQISDQSVAISSDPGFSTVEVAVAMNKMLLESHFPDETGKWFFTRLQLKRPFRTEDTKRLNLRYQMNLPGNSLTRTQIEVGEQVIGFIFFSAVKQ